MLVRFNVHVLGYSPEDEVELDDEWATILVPSHATDITPAPAEEPTPEEEEPTPPVEDKPTPPVKKPEPETRTKRA